MVEIKEISNGQDLAANTHYVLIELTDAGRFTARGLATYADGANLFTPAPFGSLEAAIAISKAWAETNNVRVIYVRR